MTTTQPVVCSYCGQTIPEATLFYTLKALGNSTASTVYCSTDFGLHRDSDVDSALQSFGAVTLQRNLTEGG